VTDTDKTTARHIFGTFERQAMEQTTAQAALVDRVARIIGAAIYRPQPHMSGDIWQRLGALRQRGCEDAARAAIEEIARG